MPEVPERVAALALAAVPAHLRPHTSEQLRVAIRRGFVLGVEPLWAYLRLHLGSPRDVTVASELGRDVLLALSNLALDLASWSSPGSNVSEIYELAEFGLPHSPEELREWAAANMA